MTISCNIVCVVFILPSSVEIYTHAHTHTYTCTCTHTPAVAALCLYCCRWRVFLLQVAQANKRCTRHTSLKFLHWSQQTFMTSDSMKTPFPSSDATEPKQLQQLSPICCVYLCVQRMLLLPTCSKLCHTDTLARRQHHLDRHCLLLPCCCLPEGESTPWSALGSSYQWTEDKGH